MTLRQDAATYVKNGLSPSAVATKMNKTVQQVRMFLLEQIAERELFPTEVLMSISCETKSTFETYIAESNSKYYWDLVNNSVSHGFEREEFRLYLDCRGSLRRDLYVGIADLEVFLHTRIREILIAEFGPAEHEWWRLGVPEQVRISCATSREADPYPPGESYSYTTFINLSKIIEKNWQIFHFRLPAEIASNKKALFEQFNRLNAIRNAVMHPVKGEQLSENDFIFAQEVTQLLGNPGKWRP